MSFSWNGTAVARPKVVITAQNNEFDQATIQNWRAEGFEVSYLPFTGSREDYIHCLQHLADPLEIGEDFAILGKRALVRSKSKMSD